MGYYTSFELETKEAIDIKFFYRNLMNVYKKILIFVILLKMIL